MFRGKNLFHQNYTKVYFQNEFISAIREGWGKIENPNITYGWPSVYMGTTVKKKSTCKWTQVVQTCVKGQLYIGINLTKEVQNIHYEN